MAKVFNICPYKHKYELVNWLTTYQGWSISHANNLRKKQLYAIWYKWQDAVNGERNA